MKFKEDMFDESKFFKLREKDTAGLARYRRNYEDWESIRLAVRIRDNFTCQRCGITEEELGRALDVHHKNPFLKSEDSSLDNLITLCRSCHKKADLELEKNGIVPK